VNGVNVLEQLQDSLRNEIRKAVIESGLAKVDEVPDVVLETPKDKVHGDVATNMAMQLSRIARRNPRDIAEHLVRHVDKRAAHVEK